MTDILRIGVAHRGAGLSPVFAAIADGSMARAGVSPVLIDTPGHAAALAALEDGEVDVINSVGPEVLRHNAEHDGTAVVLASAIGRAAVEVFVRPGWPEARSIDAARWGVLGRGDPDHVTALQVFELNGWDQTKLQLVEVPDGPDRLSRLLRPDHVDAVVMHAPEPALAARQGWRRAFDMSRYDLPMQNSCAVTSRQALEQKGGALEHYIAAYLRGSGSSVPIPTSVVRCCATPVPGLMLPLSIKAGFTSPVS